MEWLQSISRTLADRTATQTITLTPDAVRTLLDVARIASHTSGERINAPLLCYVLGMMDARGVPLEKTAAVIKETLGEDA
ncbi:MAG: DUF6457 domain-containing protein [Actinomycetota bacterium]